MNVAQSTHEDSSDEEGAWDEGAAGRGEGDAGAHELALRPRTHSFSSASSGEPDGTYQSFIHLTLGQFRALLVWSTSII